MGALFTAFGSEFVVMTTLSSTSQHLVSEPSMRSRKSFKASRPWLLALTTRASVYE